MTLNGTMAFIGGNIEQLFTGNPLLIAIIIFIASAAISSFTANAPVAIMFIPIIQQIVESSPINAAYATPLIMGLLFGVVLGGNILPQGAAYFIVSLNIAKEQKVEGFTYNNYFRVGGPLAVFHIILGLVYLLIYVAIVI